MSYNLSVKGIKIQYALILLTVVWCEPYSINNQMTMGVTLYFQFSLYRMRTLCNLAVKKNHEFLCFNRYFLRKSNVNESKIIVLKICQNLYEQVSGFQIRWLEGSHHNHNHWLKLFYCKHRWQRWSVHGLTCHTDLHIKRVEQKHIKAIKKNEINIHIQRFTMYNIYIKCIILS